LKISPEPNLLLVNFYQWSVDPSFTVPADLVVSQTREENEFALKQMERVLKADVRPSDDLNLVAIARTMEDQKTCEEIIRQQARVVLYSGAKGEPGSNLLWATRPAHRS